MGLVRALRACCVFALAGCPTVDLGETPADIGVCNPNGGIAYFQSMIWPSYLHNPAMTCGSSHTMSCDCARSGCHLAPGGAGGLGFGTNVPADFALDYQAAQQELDCTMPEASKLLTRPLAGVDPHGGQDIFAMSDPQYQLFLNWFK
jgi:hypothetical protein